MGADGVLPTVPRLVGVEVDGRAYDVRLHVTEAPWADLARRRRRAGAGRRGVAGDGAVVSPMQGTVLTVAVADGDAVEAGQLLCVVEAMKMENEIVAPRVGVVRDLAVSAGAPSRAASSSASSPPGVSDVEDLVERLVGESTLTGRRSAGPGRRIRTSRGGSPSSRDPPPGRPLARASPLRRRTTDENLDGPRSSPSFARRSAAATARRCSTSPDADWQVLAGRGEPRILRRPPTRPPAEGTRPREAPPLPEGEPVPFLVALGVQTPDGRVRSQRRAKFRQVNRFVELVEDIVPALPDGRLRIVDFGSGAPT